MDTSIEGVYTNAHTVRSVDNADEAVEDVVEIVFYDPTHVFLRIATRFDNGHSCAVRVSPRWNMERSFIGAASWLSTTTSPARSESKRRGMNFASAIGSNQTAPRRVVSSAVFEATCPTSPLAECTDGRFGI
jgi:hypothetical protein